MASSVPEVGEMAKQLSLRLQELRNLAKEIQSEVKAVSDSKGGVTRSVLKASGVGKEAVKTARVLLQCQTAVSEAISYWKLCATKESTGNKRTKYKHCRMAITFAGVVENGVGMQQIGTDRRPIDPERMANACKNLDQRKIPYKLYTLNENLPSAISPSMKPATAQLLVVPNYLETLMSVADGDQLYHQISGLKWDRKKFNPRTKKVCNSHARENNCFADIAQEADYPAGKGTIIAFRDTGALQHVRADIGTLLGEGYAGLNAEGNKYDTRAVLNGERKSTPKGIGWHGDAERHVVVCLCLGMPMDLHFAWYHMHKQVEGQSAFKVTLRHGDLYVMGAKTVGRDWKRSSALTLRHSAGHPKYTDYAPKKKKKRTLDMSDFVVTTKRNKS